MWPFLVFGSLFAVAATLGRARSPDRFVWFAFLIMAILFVGLRHHVGMDWNNYLRMIYSADSAPSLGGLLQVAEPTYALLLKFGAWSGGGIYVVNLIATTVTMIGVFAYARKTPEPWLALMAALPIFIVVVCMSANRQALAAGILMFVLARWFSWGVVGRALGILFAASCHASAIIFLVFILVDLKIPRALKVVGALVFAALAFYFLQQSGFASYYNQAYGSGQTEQVQSSGAVIHIAMTAVPAAFFFLFPRFRKTMFPTTLLRNMAFAAMLTLPLVALASAAAGRISLYWFPVAMYVWASFPQVLDQRFRRLARLGICALMLSIMVGWLQYANSSIAHIPYYNALFVEPWELEIGVLP